MFLVSGRCPGARSRGGRDAAILQGTNVDDDSHTLQLGRNIDDDVHARELRRRRSF